AVYPSSDSNGRRPVSGDALSSKDTPRHPHEQFLVPGKQNRQDHPFFAEAHHVFRNIKAVPGFAQPRPDTGVPGAKVRERLRKDGIQLRYREKVKNRNTQADDVFRTESHKPTFLTDANIDF